MRKLFTYVIGWLLAVVITTTANPYLPLLTAGVGSSCSTVSYTQNSSGNNQNVASAASNQSVGTRFTAATTGTKCKVECTLRRSGSATGTLTAYLFPHDAGGNIPSAAGPLATSSNTIDSSTLSTSYGTSTFNFSVSLTASTFYWVVIRKSSTSGAAFVQWEGQATTGRTAASSDNVTFSGATTVACDITIYE
jgi:hypothetical protein